MLKFTFSGYARPGIEEGPLLRRLLAQGLDARLRSRRFDALPNDLLELGRLRCGQPVRGVHLRRPAIFDERGVELVLLLEITGPADVFERRALLGTFERDLELGSVGILLDRLGEVLNCRVPVTVARRELAVTERPPGRAAGHESRQHETDH